MAPPSWAEVIYVIPLYGVSRGLNLNLSSMGGRSLKLTEPRQGATFQTEARPCEAEVRPIQLKKLPRGRLEPRQMPRGLHPCIQRDRTQCEQDSKALNNKHSQPALKNKPTHIL